MKNFIAAAILFIASACAALAQTSFPTPLGTGPQAQGFVNMCLNTSGQAVPCGVGAASYNSNATPIAGNASGTTGAVVGTLAAAAAKTTYLCDFDISAIGGTAAIGPVVVAGLLGGSKTYQLSSAAAGVNFSKSFSPCIPASAANTAITITTTANGTATAVNVNSDGFQQ